jgi:hypothetical protein
MRNGDNEHDRMTFKTWVINLFEDERERTSIKPVIAFLGAIFLCGTMLANSINPDFIPADFLVDAVMIITAIGMGADSLDKFSFRRHPKTPKIQSEEYDEYYSNDQSNNPNIKPDENIGTSSNQLL